MRFRDLLMTSFLVAPGIGSANVINVPGDFSTIQAGIEASADNDTVLVQPGTYQENLNFNGHNIVVGSLFLTTEDDAYIVTTIIDGNQTGSVVIFASSESEQARLIGFTIQNGLADDGGGIYCNGSQPTITHNTIQGNQTTITGLGSGGGIYCENALPIIEYNNIMDNVAGFGGGGIHCRTNSNAIIRFNTISGNGALGNLSGLGGGIYCGDNSNPEINFNVIHGNSVNNYGGGICSHLSNPTINQNTIYNNSAYSYYQGNGGGICCLECSPEITNTIIWGNHAPEGDQIYEYDGIADVTFCDIQGGWTGEGNIDCRPLFCNSAEGDFQLAETSCCLGAGEGGVDIGALGAGCEMATIPTLSEWGLIILGLLLLAGGTVAIIRRYEAITFRR